MQFLILDTETTGFKVPPPPASGVVQIAWCQVDPQHLEQNLPIYCTMVDPECEIDPGASAVHGIYADDVKGCPTLGEVLQLKRPTVVVGHNVSFDLRFIGAHIENLLGYLCTYELAKRYIRNTRNHKLTTLAEDLNLRQGKAHDAGGDVYTTRELLKYICGKMEMSVEALYQKHNLPSVYDVMPFGKHKNKKLGDVPLAYLQWYLNLPTDSQDKSLRMTMNLELGRRGLDIEKLNASGRLSGK